MASYTRNFVIDYGAPTNGTSDASVAWESFTTFLAGLAAGDVVTLTVPSHTYVFNKGAVAGIQMLPGLLGGLTVTVNAPTGATFTDGVGGSGFFLANLVGLYDDNQHSSRIASVNAGSTAVLLLTPAEHTRYAVGRWIMVAGLDPQGFGSPCNPAYFEFAKIAAKDTETGGITCDRPLRNRYLSTWPLYNPGSAEAVPNAHDCGGPATIYALPVGWDIDATWNNITFSQEAQIYFKGRRAVFNGGGVTSTAGIVPTLNQHIEFNDFDQSGCFIEVDKLVENLSYNGCTINQLIFQSMSCATNCTVIDSDVETYNGTPQNLVISGGSTDSLQIGVTSYGRTDSLRVDNCVIAAFSYSSVSVAVAAAGYTMTNGVIRWPKSGNGPLPWAIPGTNVFFGGTKPNQNYNFRVLSVEEDGIDTIVRTTLSGGFPNVPGTLGLRVHPCPIWYGSGNTGCAEAVELSLPGAQGQPIFSYTKRTYTGAWRTSPNFQQWGELVEVNVNVLTAYTGAQGTLTAEILGQGGGTLLTVDKTATLSYDPIINLKQTGARSIEPGSVSGQAGDTLGAAPGAIWFAGVQNVYSSANIAGEASGLWPSVEIEIITDQHLIRQVVPLLGLRAA